MRTSLQFRPMLVVLFMAALALPSAFSMDITYTTTGSFSCSGAGYLCSGTSLTGPNGLHITFGGVIQQFPNVSVPPPSYAPFGTITVSGEINKTTTDTLPANTSFTLNVTQSLPAPGGTEVLHDKFTGTIKIANSTISLVLTSGNGAGGVANLTNNPLSPGVPAFKFSFGPVDYWVDQTTPIHPEACANPACTTKRAGVSIINGAITTTVPEPMFYPLTAAGLAGLFALARRRPPKLS